LSMTTSRRVVSQGLKYMMLHEFLERKLMRANYVHSQFFKTPNRYQGHHIRGNPRPHYREARGKYQGTC